VRDGGGAGHGTDEEGDVRLERGAGFGRLVILRSAAVSRVDGDQKTISISTNVVVCDKESW